jgi:hypothetical protein
MTPYLVVSHSGSFIAGVGSGAVLNKLWAGPKLWLYEPITTYNIDK